MIKKDIIYADIHGINLYLGTVPSTLPEGVREFSDAKNEMAKLMEKIDSALYDQLEVPCEMMADTPDNIKNIAIKEARIKRLRHREIEKYAPSYMEQPIDLQMIVDWLSGRFDPQTERKELFEQNMKEWQKAKRYNILLEQYLETPCLIEPYEEEIAKSLKRCEKAKYVRVTFKHNGEEHHGKITPKEIWSKLIKRDNFWKYDFTPSDSYFLDNELSCQDIIRITYGKKVLYEKSV